MFPILKFCNSLSPFFPNFPLLICFELRMCTRLGRVVAWWECWSLRELTRVFVSACLHDSGTDFKLLPSEGQRLPAPVFYYGISLAPSGKLCCQRSHLEIPHWLQGDISYLRSVLAKAGSKMRFKERKTIHSIMIFCWFHSSTCP